MSIRTSLTKARLACENLERELREAAKDAKCDAIARGDGGEDEAGAWSKLESAADTTVKAIKSLLDVRSWTDAAELRGWESGKEG